LFLFFFTILANDHNLPLYLYFIITVSYLDDGVFYIAELFLNDKHLNVKDAADALFKAAALNQRDIIVLLLSDRRVMDELLLLSTKDNPFDEASVLKLADKDGFELFEFLYKINGRRCRILKWAVKRGITEPFVFILREPQIIESETALELLELSISYGRFDILKLFLEDGRFYHFYKGLDISDTLQALIKTGNYEMLKFVLEDERVVCDPSFNNNKAIRVAAEVGNFEIFSLLLKDPRVDPTAFYNEAIISACENGHYDIVKALMNDPRLDPAEYLNEARSKAHGHRDILRLLSRLDRE
jgi:ankyrin repeat protein